MKQNTFLLFLLLVIPSLSLFSWNKTLLIPQDQLDNEATKLNQLFEYQEGEVRISSVEFINQTLNLTFLHEPEEYNTTLVSLYLSFPTLLESAPSASQQPSTTAENSSFTLVYVSQANQTNQTAVYESSLDYAFKYVPFSSLILESPQISIQISFTNTSPDDFFQKVIMVQYASFAVFVVLIVVVFFPIMEIQKNVNYLFIGYMTLLSVPLRIELDLSMNIAKISNGMTQMYLHSFCQLLAIAFLLLSGFIIMVTLKCPQLKIATVANCLLSVLLFFWFNDLTLIVFTAVNMYTIVMNKQHVIGSDPLLLKVRAAIIELLMSYFFLFKVSSDFNPGPYPYSFEKCELLFPEITIFMMMLIVGNGIMSLDFFGNLMVRGVKKCKGLIEKARNQGEEEEISQKLNYPRKSSSDLCQFSTQGNQVISNDQL